MNGIVSVEGIYKTQQPVVPKWCVQKRTEKDQSCG
jgi:hypothetical protein